MAANPNPNPNPRGVPSGVLSALVGPSGVLSALVGPSGVLSALVGPSGGVAEDPGGGAAGVLSLSVSGVEKQKDLLPQRLHACKHTHTHTHTHRHTHQGC